MTAGERDRCFMAAVIALATRGRGRTSPNPNVGCLIVDAAGRVVGRGWTQPGGRPHAEAVALSQAGDRARGATVYVSLEPCAHESPRGPACADLLIAANPARVMVALTDPDPRTDGRGTARLRAAGIEVTEGILAAEAARAADGFIARLRHGRPQVTLKLAMSIDGRIALRDGTSRWITGPEARAHAHVERAQMDAILVGRGTIDADAPALSVRLPGLSERGPRRLILTRNPAPEGWTAVPDPLAIADLDGVDRLMVEGGAGAAAAFLRADLIDRILLYRAPILIGWGRPGIGDIGLVSLDEAHDRWRHLDGRMLGSDRLDVYERVRS